MKIELTKEQYANLVKLVYLGNYVVNALRPQDEQVREFNDVEQTVYSFAADGGMGDYILFEPSLKRYITNWEKDRRPDVDRYIDEYNERDLWHELAHRLARRDLVCLLGEEKVQSMRATERVEEEDPLIEKYSDELRKHGVKNLVIHAEEMAPF